MEQLIEALCAALCAAGLRAVAGMPAAATPRLQAPGIAVGLESAENNQSGLFHYLGMEDDPELGPVERYGGRLAAVLRLDVCSPRQDGAAGAQAAADAVCAVLLQGVPGLQIRRFTVDAPVYQKQADLFLAAVHIQAEAWLYATRSGEAACFDHFILKGAIQ